MQVTAETLGNVLLIVLTLLVAIGAGNLLLSAARSLWKRRRWDFFLSYKSENANEVRRIAERLMAAGYQVWFAEYEVLLRSYDQFQPRIYRGTQNCSFALLFTTNSYSRSKHCCDEVKWLKQHFTNEPGRIIEVSLEEPNDARNALGLSAQSPRLSARLPARITQERGEDSDLLSRLETLTGMVLNRGAALKPAGGGDPRFRARCAPISFETIGFVLKEWKTHRADDTDIAFFQGQPGPVRFGFNVYFHYSPQKAPGLAFTVGGDPLDDRKLYTELRTYASWFMKAVRMLGVLLKERGLHLIWRDGRTQIALTHSFLWVRMRKYSVILGELPQPIQIIFTFAVTGDFDDFCRFVPFMDRVIDSIQIESGGKSQKTSG